MRVSLRESLLLMTILAFVAFHLAPLMVPRPEPALAKLDLLFPVTDETFEIGQEHALSYPDVDSDDEPVVADLLLSASATAIENILDETSVDYRRWGHGHYGGSGETERRGDRPHCSVALVYRLQMGDTSESELYEQLMVALDDKLDENSTSVSASYRRELGYMEWVRNVGDTHYELVICMRPRAEDDSQLSLLFRVTGTAFGERATDCSQSKMRR